MYKSLKPSKKQSIKAFCFGFILILFSCQQEDDQLILETSQQPSIESVILNEAQIKEIPAISNIVLNFPQKTNYSDNTSYQARGGSIDEPDFYVNQESAIRITSGEYESYTFSVTRTVENELTENLLLSKQADGNFDAKLISYDLTDDEKNSITNGVLPFTTPDYADKITVQNVDITTNSLDDDIIWIDEIHRIFYNKNTGGCGIWRWEIDNGYLHEWVEEYPCPEQYHIDDSLTEDGSGGGGGGSPVGDDDPFDGDDDPFDNVNPPSTWDNLDGLLGGAPGTGSQNGSNLGNNNGGSDSSETGDTSNEEVEDCLALDQFGNCIDGITKPLIPLNDDPLNDDPCPSLKEDLKKVFPNASDNTLDKITDAINKYADKLGLDTKEKIQHFIAQAAVESHNLESFREYTNYRPARAMEVFKGKFNAIGSDNADPNKKNLSDFYTQGNTYLNAEDFYNWVYADENRSVKTRLGNTEPGDGWKYRGRGIIQLTGRENYENFSNWYKNNINSNSDLLSNPSLLQTDLEIGTISGMYFFQRNVLNKITVDENTSINKVTYRVNSKMEGLSERKAFLKDAKENIDCK